jgi:hypothetical protein
MGPLAAVVMLAFALPASGREVLTPEEIVEREFEERKKAKPVLVVEPSELRVSVREDERKTVRLTVRNGGGGKLRWSVRSSPRWVALDVRGGELGYGEERDLFLTVDPAGTKDTLLRETISFEAPAADGSPTIIPIETAVPDRARKEPEPPPVPAVAPKPPARAPASAVVAPATTAAKTGFRYMIEAGYVREMTGDPGSSYDLDGPEMSGTFYFRRVPTGRYPLDAAAFAHHISWAHVRVFELGAVDYDDSRSEIEAMLRYVPGSLPFEARLRFRDSSYDENYGPGYWEKSSTLRVNAGLSYFLTRTISAGGLFGVRTDKWEGEEAGYGYYSGTSSGTMVGGVARGILPLGAGKALGFEGLYVKYEDDENDSSVDVMQAELSFYPSLRTRLGVSVRTEKPEGGDPIDTYGSTLVANSAYGAGLGLTFLRTESTKTSTVKAWFVLRK